MFSRTFIRDRDAVVVNGAGFSEYLNACLNDLKDITSAIYSISRFPNQKLYPRENFVFDFSENLSFGASVGWGTKDSVVFELPLGLLLAIDDLCLRLVSNMDFFSFDPLDNGKRKWHGCSCQWNIPYGGFKPNLRFLDYTPVRILPSEPTARPYGTYISNFVEVFPYDNEREELYRYMVLIAIAWVFLHEEGHYSGGHLHALKDSNKQEVFLSASGNSENPFTNSMIFKSAEWEADRSATDGVVDCFLTTEFSDFLPSYAKPSFRWQARIILAVIGSVIEIIQKSRVVNSTENNYPSPRARLISAAFHFYHRMLMNQELYHYEISNEDFHFICAGAFDDINTVSDLINREGNIGKWDEKNPPVQEKSRNQKLFDTPYESKAAYEIFMSRFRNKVNVHDNKTHEKLYKKWFKESENIAVYHQKIFWPKFSIYRSQTGMPND